MDVGAQLGELFVEPVGSVVTFEDDRLAAGLPAGRVAGDLDAPRPRGESFDLVSDEVDAPGLAARNVFFLDAFAAERTGCQAVRIVPVPLVRARLG